ncbi:hypothetical protein [Sphingobium fuliginis]|uniref:Uncharacterized protein n=1 Tax=Sphingobium fuliginis ATCC 27551 TaxID=1208342 RepID=A0A5B8CIG6_SPHSA|nr:hypothetical protein [Sphingobium fuliginis]QDC38695.1 hypothetical protein FIL70_17030 [Sphingobium fuliginis ATCC 27551]
MYRLLAVAVLFVSNPALAEECSDVLKDGTRESATWSNNFVSTQIAYSLLQSSDETQRQQEKASEFGLSYGPWSANSKSSKSLAEAYKRQLKKVNLVYLNEAQQINGAKSAGDLTITNAWLKCMQGRQGLVAYFLPETGTSATLFLKWVRDPNDPQSPPETKLRNTISFPDWMKPIEVDGPRCWKIYSSVGGREGDGIIDVGGCNVSFALDPQHSKKPVSMRIDTYRGGADVFLAPRIRYVEEEKVVKVEALIAVPVVHNYIGVEQAGDFNMSQEDVDAGWIIDPTSFVGGTSSIHSVSLHKKWARSCGAVSPTEEKSKRKNNPFLISDHHVSIGAYGLYRHHGTPGEHLTCKVTGTVRMFRVREELLS